MNSTTVGSTPEELLRGYSLEMTAKDIPALEAARSAIPLGTRIHVTFLGNENLDMRVGAAAAVRSAGFTPVPHISARRLESFAALKDFLDRLSDVGASRSVFVVGGDPSEPHGPFEDALSVIRTGILQDYGVEEVSIAGYPEGHPSIANSVLNAHLERKIEALAEQRLNSAIVTQFSFDADSVFKWIADIRAKGIKPTIRVGAPGPAGVKRLLGYASRFGVSANTMIAKKYGFSLTNLLGAAGPDRFISNLGEKVSGTEGIAVHLYTFGGLHASAAWAASYLREDPTRLRRA